MSEPLLLVILCLASYRVWRIVGQDDWPPSRRFRGFLEARATYHGGQVTRFGELKDVGDYGRELRKHARHHTFWDELQTMIECPWCLGFWVSGVVVVGVETWYQDLPAWPLWWLAVSCVVGLIGTALDA